MESIFAVVVLLLDIWAIINIVGSNSTVMAKAGWIIGIIILPIIGFIVWYFAGPKSGGRLTA